MTDAMVMNLLERCAFQVGWKRGVLGANAVSLAITGRSSAHVQFPFQQLVWELPARTYRKIKIVVRSSAQLIAQHLSGRVGGLVPSPVVAEANQEHCRSFLKSQGQVRPALKPLN